MTFWGVEVKPKKPFTLSEDEFEGPRLHLTQATLGKTNSKERVIVKVKIEGSPSIFLCSLLPGVLETCSLNTYFSNKAVFSVEGSATVHLVGYFELEGEEGSVDDDYYEDEDEEEEEEVEDEDEADDDSVIYTDDSVGSDYGFSTDEEVVIVPSSGVKIEEVIEEPSVMERNWPKDALIKYENGGDLFKNNVKSNNRAAEVNEVGGNALPSEDEDGFPLKSKRTHEMAEDQYSLKKPKRGLQSQAEADPSNVLRNEEVPLEDDPLSRSATKATKEERKKKKKKEKNVQEQAEVPEQEVPAMLNVREDGVQAPSMNGSPSQLAGGDDTSATKKKKKKKRKKDKKTEALSEQQEPVHKSCVKALDLKQGANNVDIKWEERSSDAPNKKGYVRKYANGLEVENISMGKPDGKQAKLGKKVAMTYVGKLKSNGKIFDSNVGKKPLVFRLGVGEVIKGWDIGVCGMRIGDKRRLTIPPAMGYGQKGVQGIPPNSWLVFEVELTDVK